MHLVEQVHAILLTGGSAFGLAAADGVVRWLEEHQIGFETGVVRVPIVPAAVLFDLSVGRSDVRPDAAMGYAACQAANNDDFGLGTGTIGAGTGASVGHILGPEACVKGGLGTAVVELEQGIFIGALIVVNCFGDVINPGSGQILAGARKLPEGNFLDTMQALQSIPRNFSGSGHTVIGSVVTNGRLSKEVANKVAQMAHDGLARVIRPAHTMFDGDTIFALATGHGPVIDTNLVGAFAAEVTAQAIINAVQTATSLAGIPAVSDLEFE
jgi:L-aminopeptidase/D-esterase-like protein